MFCRNIFLAIALLLTSINAVGSPADEEALPSIDLIPQALGDSHWQITTSNTEAQAMFDQGIQLRWAYNMRESARSMATARRLDPNCAMCFWGSGGLTRFDATWVSRAMFCPRVSRRLSSKGFWSGILITAVARDTSMR